MVVITLTWQNGWKKADNKDVLNIDLWQELYALSKVHQISFNKVKGHADNPLNNRCDELARLAVSECRKLLVDEIE